MRVAELRPAPTEWEPFRRDRLPFVPERSGCYALVSAAGTILYVGLTTRLRARMAQHLDTPGKTEPTPMGRALRFHWLETARLEATERGWLNSHCLVEGALPVLNKVQSPVIG